MLEVSQLNKLLGLFLLYCSMVLFAVKKANQEGREFFKSKE